MQFLNIKPNENLRQIKSYRGHKRLTKKNLFLCAISKNGICIIPADHCISPSVKHIWSIHIATSLHFTISKFHNRKSTYKIRDLLGPDAKLQWRNEITICVVTLSRLSSTRLWICPDTEYRRPFKTDLS